MIEPVREYYYNGNIEFEAYYINGKRHKEDGPAVIAYYENGNIKYMNYCINGVFHREDGPAVIGYYENGNIEYEKYYINDELHREDGPALIIYYQNGELSSISFYINGEEHKEDGPSGISYCKNNSIIYSYCVHNWCYNKEHMQYISQLNDSMILQENDINKLKIMKIVCIEQNNDELLAMIDRVIISLKLQGK